MKIALETCEALEEVHGSHLLHKDIKPANIILTHDGRTVLIDFGSAREFQASRTARHTRILTEEYAAPEQYGTQARFGPYTDIFCLGATLFHALTGDPPARALDRLQSTDPSLSFPKGFHGPLCNAIHHSLNLTVQDRPQTISDFRQLLGNSKTTSSLSSNKTFFSNKSQSVTTHYVDKPYVFKDQEYYSPPELASALGEDWDAAIEDWKRGYIRTWMTSAVTGGNFEREIDNMQEDSFFALRESDSTSSGNETQGDMNSVKLDRQLMRVLALLDPNWEPSYRGIPLENKEAICDWINNRDNGSRDLLILDRCMEYGILRTHPKKFGRKLHENFQRELRVLHQLPISYSRIMSASNMLRPRTESRKFQRRILMYLVGAVSTEVVCSQMEEDKKAMRVRWFSDLVQEASSSAACAAVLTTLQPIARKQRNGKIFWSWVGFGVFLLIVISIFSNV